MAKPLFLLLLSLSFVSCSQQAKLLEVDVLKLRETKLAEKDASMVRGDQKFMLYGKVSAKEQAQTLGQYYTVLRRDTEKKAKVKFHYLQAATQSKKHSQEAYFKPSQKKLVFEVTGNDYTENGRVLAWKIELIESGKVIASEQSYMW